MSSLLSTEHQLIAASLIAAALATAQPAAADSKCMPIAAPSLEIGIVDCSQVWPQLLASRRFPDLNAGSGKMTNVCYAATGAAPATIGGKGVTITSTLSGWTTDFTPVLFGGTDNLGTVVTQLSIAGLSGNSTAALYTRDTIDLSRLLAGTVPEEDVIVGGVGPLQGASGTYRINSAPEDQTASKVLLTNLSGQVCFDGQ